MSLCVFIPAYNAAKTIEEVLSRIPSSTWEIIETVIVINDGSEDNTTKIVEQLKKKYEKLHLISFEKNRGYGETVRKGMKLGLETTADFIACLHADGQYPPEKLYDFVQYMESHQVDVLQGSRHKEGGALKGGMPVYKFVAGKFLTWLENMVFGLKMTDYHSGYLLYSRKAVNAVPVDNLSGYFDFDLEFIAYALKRDLKIDELGIPTHYGNENSYLNPIWYGLRALGVLCKYLWGYYD